MESLPPTTFADPEELSSSNRTAVYVLVALLGGGGLLLGGVLVLLVTFALRLGDEEPEVAWRAEQPKPAVVAAAPKPVGKTEPEKPKDGVQPKLIPGPKEPKPAPVEQPNLPAVPMVQPNIPPPFRPAPRPAEPDNPKIRFLSTTPVEVKAPVLAADTAEVKLAETVTDACVGGGGRYWILHLGSIRQAAIFDLNEAKVVKHLPVPGDARIAAGMHKLVVIDPEAKTIARYDLSTLAKEKTARLSVSPTSVCMGSASAGPVVVRTEGQFRNSSTAFFDLASLKEVHIANLDRLHMGIPGEHIRASPDGRVLGNWSTRHSPSGLNSILLSPRGLAGHYQHTSAGFVLPTANGQLMTGIGVFTPEARALKAGAADIRLRIPSQTGPWYLRIPGGGGVQANTLKSRETDPTEVVRVGEDRPIATLQHVKLPAENEAWVGHDFTGDKRVLFVPDTRLIAVIPPTRDRIVLHRFDLDEALEKSGADYLFVNSRPHPAVPGKIFQYPIGVKSKSGGVKLKLNAGPAGMVLNGNTLLWNVPAEWTGPETVVVSHQDASEREELYSFTLSPADPELEPKK